MNVVILRGRLSSPPRPIQLPSGDQVLTLEVTVRDAEDAPADSVPVAWFNAPEAAAAWVAGTQVVVVGRVRRRFFRAGDRTASRTEVVAESALPASRRAAVRKSIGVAILRAEAIGA
jgi:single-strand DNA-binding protein